MVKRYEDVLKELETQGGPFAAVSLRGPLVATALTETINEAYGLGWRFISISVQSSPLLSHLVVFERSLPLKEKEGDG